LRVLTAEQSRLFLEAAMPTAYGPVFAVALTTAARPSEYLALKWQDINWEQGTVSIARTLERINGSWRFAETKRARSRRVIRLQGWVLELLQDLHAESKAKPAGSSWPGTSDVIFTTPSGQPIHADKLATKIKSILQKAGLPIMRLYDLRHTGATLALAAGVLAKVVSEQLGHASAAFTLDIYSHVLPHMQEQAAINGRFAPDFRRMSTDCQSLEHSSLPGFCAIRCAGLSDSPQATRQGPQARLSVSIPANFPEADFWLASLRITFYRMVTPLVSVRRQFQTASKT
jgi:Phage integrase family